MYTWDPRSPAKECCNIESRGRAVKKILPTPLLYWFSDSHPLSLSLSHTHTRTHALTLSLAVFTPIISARSLRFSFLIIWQLFPLRLLERSKGYGFLSWTPFICSRPPQKQFFMDFLFHWTRLGDVGSPESPGSVGSSGSSGSSGSAGSARQNWFPPSYQHRPPRENLRHNFNYLALRPLFFVIPPAVLMRKNLRRKFRC